MLSDFLVSGSTPYADEVIEDHQCGFQRAGILYSSDIEEKVRVQWDSTSVTDFDKTYD
jgi:hypothetical protein